MTTEFLISLLQLVAIFAVGIGIIVGFMKWRRHQLAKNPVRPGQQGAPGPDGPTEDARQAPKGGAAAQGTASTVNTSGMIR